MNTLSRVLAAELMDQFREGQAADNIQLGDLVLGLSEDKDSLHLCLGKNNKKSQKSSNDMTAAEYRAYIEAEILAAKRHARQEAVSFTVHITQTGLHLMQSSQEYENYVLGAVAAAFGQPYQSPFAENCLLYFDTKENSCCMNWSSMDKMAAAGRWMEAETAQEALPPKAGSGETEAETAQEALQPKAGSGKKEQAENAPQAARPSHSENQKKDGSPAMAERVLVKEYQYNRIHLPYAYYMPVSRYEKILYAYNIMPEEWMLQKRRP